MPNGWGGRRSGAGRKRKTEKYQTPIQQAENRIKDRLPELVDSLFVLAAGEYEEKEIDGRMVRIYTRPPDGKACQYLLDRVLGRPALESSSKAEAPQGPQVHIFLPQKSSY